MTRTHRIMKPCVLLFGYYGRQNLGDEIMLTVLVERLRGLWPDCRIVATCRGDESRLSALGIENLRDPSSATAECDVLIIGGGSQFHDVGPWGWRGPWSILRVIRAARKRGKKVVLLAVGFGPLVSLRGRVASWMSAWLADLVTVRDPASAAFLRQGFVPQRKVHVTADLGFLFRDQANLPPRTEVLDQIRALPRPRVGVNVFGHLDTSAVTTRHRRGPTADDAVRQGVFAEAIDRVIEDTGGTAVFVAGQGAVDGCDYDEAQRVRARMKHADRSINLGYDSSLVPYFAILKEVDVLVAMKLHLLVLGYMVGSPILGIEYQSKICDVLQYAEVDSICDAKSLTSSDLVRRINQLLYEKPDHSKRIEQLSECAERNFDLISKVMY